MTNYLLVMRFALNSKKMVTIYTILSLAMIKPPTTVWLKELEVYSQYYIHQKVKAGFFLLHVAML